MTYIHFLVILLPWSGVPAAQQNWQSRELMINQLVQAIASPLMTIVQGSEFKSSRNFQTPAFHITCFNTYRMLCDIIKEASYGQSQSLVSRACNHLLPSTMTLLSVLSDMPQAFVVLDYITYCFFYLNSMPREVEASIITTLCNVFNVEAVLKSPVCSALSISFLQVGNVII